MILQVELQLVHKHLYVQIHMRLNTRLTCPASSSACQTAGGQTERDRKSWIKSLIIFIISFRIWTRKWSIAGLPWRSLRGVWWLRPVWTPKTKCFELSSILYKISYYQKLLMLILIHVYARCWIHSVCVCVSVPPPSGPAPSAASSPPVPGGASSPSLVQSSVLLDREPTSLSLPA